MITISQCFLIISFSSKAYVPIKPKTEGFLGKDSIQIRIFLFLQPKPYIILYIKTFSVPKSKEVISGWVNNKGRPFFHFVFS